MNLAMRNVLLLCVLSSCDTALDPGTKVVPNPAYVACQEDRNSDDCEKFCAEHSENDICTDAGPSMDASPNIDGGGIRDAGDGAVVVEAGLEGDASQDAGWVDAGCPNCPKPECTTNEDCTSTHPRCSEAQKCELCKLPSDCSRFTGTPVCGADGSCVECGPEADALCTAADKVCLAGGSECVPCNENKDCKDSTAPICDAHACRGCMNDGDCKAAGLVCREATGECVACEPNKDDPDLENCTNGNACDPSTFTCTGRPRRSLGFCGKSLVAPIDVFRCVSDSECIEGHRCVATEFPQGAPYGNYCLEQVGSGTCPNQSAARIVAMSTLGVRDNYCFPDSKFTTCEGTLVFQELCDQDNGCGDPAMTDRMCEDGACTYGCDSDRDCSNGCVGPAERRYCNPN